MVLFLSSYLFWKVRYGSCQVFVYLFYPDGANDSEHALYTYPGESSNVGYETWGRVSIEDISNYQNGTLRIKFKIFLPSKLGPLSPGYFPSPQFYDDLEGLGYVFGVEK